MSLLFGVFLPPGWCADCRFNRQPVAGMSDLRAALAAVKAGDPVVLHVERGGELLYVTFVAD